MVLGLAWLRLSTHPARPGSVNLAALVVLLAFYFLPTIIAFSRRAAARVWVALINLLAGWTVVGWIVALVMAIASAREQPTVVVNVQAPPPPPSASGSRLTGP